jgi:hypothetical protein
MTTETQTLKQWSTEDLNEGDVSALASLVVAEGTDEAWTEPGIRARLKEAGQMAVVAAKITVEREKIDRMDDAVGFDNRSEV